MLLTSIEFSLHVIFTAIVPGAYPGRPKYALGWLQKLTHVPLAIAILLVKVRLKVLRSSAVRQLYDRKFQIEGALTMNAFVDNASVIFGTESKGRFPLPELTARVYGPWTRVVETDLNSLSNDRNVVGSPGWVRETGRSWCRWIASCKWWLLTCRRIGNQWSCRRNSVFIVLFL